jgi:hypothetical protein
MVSDLCHFQAELQNELLKEVQSVLGIEDEKVILNSHETYD